MGTGFGAASCDFGAASCDFRNVMVSPTPRYWMPGVVWNDKLGK